MGWGGVYHLYEHLYIPVLHCKVATCPLLHCEVGSSICMHICIHLWGQDLSCITLWGGPGSAIMRSVSVLFSLVGLHSADTVYFNLSPHSNNIIHHTECDDTLSFKSCLNKKPLSYIIQKQSWKVKLKYYSMPLGTCQFHRERSIEFHRTFFSILNSNHYWVSQMSIDPMTWAPKLSATQCIWPLTERCQGVKIVSFNCLDQGGMLLDLW